MSKPSFSSIDVARLSQYVSHQCNSFFPDDNPISPEYLKRGTELALERTLHCFSHVQLPYYRRNGVVFFNHLHGDHYCIFLCYLARIAATFIRDETVASKIFLLNKSLFGIDAFYGIELPDIFLVVHPVGTILGRAKYGNKMVFYQGVTVGATTEGIYPVFEGSTILYAHSSAIGKCNIAKNAVLGAHTSVVNNDIPAHTTVVGNYPHQRMLPGKNLIEHYFAL